MCAERRHFFHSLRKLFIKWDGISPNGDAFMNLQAVRIWVSIHVNRRQIHVWKMEIYGRWNVVWSKNHANVLKKFWNPRKWQCFQSDHVYILIYELSGIKLWISFKRRWQAKSDRNVVHFSSDQISKRLFLLNFPLELIYSEF